MNYLNREPGQLIFPASIERNINGPLDASMLINTFSALTQADTFKSIDGNDYTYKGLFTAVVNDEDEYKNGLYVLIDLPSTNPDHWIHLASIYDNRLETNNKNIIFALNELRGSAIEFLKEHNTEYEYASAILTDRINTADSNIDIVSANLVNTSSNLYKIIIDNSTTSSEGITKLNSELTELNGKVDTVSSNLTTYLQTSSNVLNNKIDTTATTIAGDIVKLNSNLTTSLETSSTTLVNLINDVSKSLNTSAITLNDLCNDLQTQINANNDNISILRTDVDIISADLNTVSGRADANAAAIKKINETTIPAVEADIDYISGQVDIVSDKANENAELIVDLRTDVNTNTKAIEAVDGKVDKLSAHVNEHIATAFSYVGVVDTYGELPNDASKGDVYNVRNAYDDGKGNVYPAGTNYAYDGSDWDALGGIVDLSPYATTSSVANTINLLRTEVINVSGTINTDLSGFKINTNNNINTIHTTIDSLSSSVDAVYDNFIDATNTYYNNTNTLINSYYDNTSSLVVSTVTSYFDQTNELVEGYFTSTDNLVSALNVSVSSLSDTVDINYNTLNTRIDKNVERIDNNVASNKSQIHTLSNSLNAVSGKADTNAKLITGLRTDVNAVSTNLNVVSGKVNDVTDSLELSSSTLVNLIGSTDNKLQNNIDDVTESLNTSAITLTGLCDGLQTQINANSDDISTHIASSNTNFNELSGAIDDNSVLIAGLRTDVNAVSSSYVDKSQITPIVNSIGKCNDELIPSEKAVRVSINTAVNTIKSDFSSVFTYKGTVSTYDDLPTENNVGDTYNVEAANGNIPAGTNYAWSNNSEWDALGGIVDLSNCALKSDVENTVEEIRTVSSKADANADDINAIKTNGLTIGSTSINTSEISTTNISATNIFKNGKEVVTVDQLVNPSFDVLPYINVQIYDEDDKPIDGESAIIKIIKSSNGALAFKLINKTAFNPGEPAEY